MKYKSILLGLLLLAAGQMATAQEVVADSTAQQVVDSTAVDESSFVVKEDMPTPPKPDALSLDRPATPQGEDVITPAYHPLVTSKIKLLTRTYGDSIVLRWVAEDFVSYHYLATFGVNVFRVEHDSLEGMKVDTLAYALKPLTAKQFEAKYPTTDSLAMVAMNVLHGEGRDEHKEKGFMPGTEDESQSQDLKYGFGMLVCEWRKDLAEDMAVRFTDRNVTPGGVYEYIIQPTVHNDSVLIFEPGVAENVVNNPYKPEPYLPQMRDSITATQRVQLEWWDGVHSGFEIERHQLTDVMGNMVPDNPWVRTTPRPYVPMVEQPDGETYCLIVDSVPALGTWEYCIRGYDSFGDITERSHTRQVFFPDMTPPSAPILKYIVIERPDSTDLMAKVTANVIWEKDSLEDDLMGYRIFYHPLMNEGEPWQAMNLDLLPPTDTIKALDMTGKRTGMMYISAYDKAGNESKSFVQQIRLTDFKAPMVPDSLRAIIRSIDLDTDTMAIKHRWAYVDLYWQPHPEDDDIAYFDIAFANDTTHKFLVRNEGGIHENHFVDSLALNANQKYVYYKVRAVDYSTNVGDWSPWIQVERPHITPPSEPHLGHSQHSDENGMYMEWIVGADADMKYHVVYRRLGESGPWDILGKFDADSIKQAGNKIIIRDNPPYSQTERYYYFCKSINSSPFTTSSLDVSWKHRGPRVLNVKIELSGTYDPEEKASRLAFFIADESTLPEGDWYFTIYRKGPGQQKFAYYMSANKEDRGYVEHTLKPGETAEYFVELQFADGRHSPSSNTVSVTCPAN